MSITRRMFWTFLFGISFFLPVHVLWFIQQPAWFPLRSYFNGLPLTLLLLAPAFLPGRAAKPWLCAFYGAFLIPAVCAGMHLLLYQTTITTHSFFALFETNSQEAGEFLQSKFSALSFAYLALLTALPLYPLARLLRAPLAFGRGEKRVILGLALIMTALVGIFGVHRLVRDHQGWLMYHHWHEFRSTTRALAAHMERTRGLTVAGVHDAWKDAPRTLVVAIGESSNRHHWSLYGYPRPTTPRLEGRRADLLVFEDAISAYALTTASVATALSYNGGLEDLGVPLINVFKQAGFETIWLSNQSTIDSFNSIVQMVSGADRHLYLNRGGDQGYVRMYDHHVLPVLKEILNTPSPTGKRVVFVHMMGSHVNYAARVPEAFNLFIQKDDLPARPWRKGRALSYINDYDNSILYTDSVLADMLDVLAEVPNSALLYFSDHGEEVYDTLPQHGHVHALRSRHYVDIPFFIWLSSGYRQYCGSERLELWRNARQQPFMLDIAGRLMLELAGVATPADARQAHNPLSVLYRPGPRLLYGVNYDEVYAKDNGLETPLP